MTHRIYAFYALILLGGTGVSTRTALAADHGPSPTEENPKAEAGTQNPTWAVDEFSEKLAKLSHCPTDEKFENRIWEIAEPALMESMSANALPSRFFKERIRAALTKQEIDPGVFNELFKQAVELSEFFSHKVRNSFRLKGEADMRLVLAQLKGGNEQEPYGALRRKILDRARRLRSAATSAGLMCPRSEKKPPIKKRRNEETPTKKTEDEPHPQDAPVTPAPPAPVAPPPSVVAPPPPPAVSTPTPIPATIPDAPPDSTPTPPSTPPPATPRPESAPVPPPTAVKLPEPVRSTLRPIATPVQLVPHPSTPAPRAPTPGAPAPTGPVPATPVPATPAPVPPKVAVPPPISTPPPKPLVPLLPPPKNDTRPPPTPAVKAIPGSPDHPIEPPSPASPGGVLSSKLSPQLFETLSSELSTNPLFKKAMAVPRSPYARLPEQIAQLKTETPGPLKMEPIASYYALVNQSLAATSDAAERAKLEKLRAMLLALRSHGPPDSIVKPATYGDPNDISKGFTVQDLNKGVEGPTAKAALLDAFSVLKSLPVDAATQAKASTDALFFDAITKANTEFSKSPATAAQTRDFNSATFGLYLRAVEARLIDQVPTKKQNPGQALLPVVDSASTPGHVIFEDSAVGSALSPVSSPNSWPALAALQGLKNPASSNADKSEMINRAAVFANKQTLLHIGFPEEREKWEQLLRNLSHLVSYLN